MAQRGITRFGVPTDIIYSLGSLGLLGEEVKKLKGTRVFFVTDPGVNAAGVLEQAFRSLQDGGISVVLCDQAPPDPDTQVIQQLAEKLKESHCDCVVTAGGGSALCTGKGVALMATNPGTIRDYSGADRYPNPPLSCIAIPTTAGSGSEVSRATIITDERTMRKMGIRGSTNAPRVAILDPMVLESVPKNQAIASGVDAWTHAIEAYCSIRATPLTDAIAFAAMETIAHNLCPSILADDLEAKSRMLLASSMANIACGNAGLGLVHAMNGAITYTYSSRGYPPVAYGLIHAICLPHVLEFNLPACEGKFASMAKAFGVNGDDKSEAELARMGIQRLKELLLAIDAPRKLPWENVQADDVVEMARVVLERAAVNPNPRKYAERDLISLFEKALLGW